MVRIRTLVVILAGIGCAARVPAAGPPPVAFEGFGLGDFQGADSVAAALRQSVGDGPEQPPFDIAVQGPGGRGEPLAPLAAELRSRFDRFDVAAGLLADAAVIYDGPAHWTGRIGVSRRDEAGSESLQLRTMLGRQEEAGVLRLELGPRLERRLRHGLTFFIDGRAEAQAVRPADAPWWSLPRLTDADAAAVGVAAQTGLVR